MQRINSLPSRKDAAVDVQVDPTYQGKHILVGKGVKAYPTANPTANPTSLYFLVKTSVSQSYILNNKNSCLIYTETVK